VPNDTYWGTSGAWGQSYPDLWGLEKIQVETAWDKSKGDNIVIATVDTGIDYYHPDADITTEDEDPTNVWVNVDEVAGDANGDGFLGIKDVDDDGDGLTDEDSQGREPGDPGYTNDLKDDDDENGYIDDLYGWDFTGKDPDVMEENTSCVANKAKIMALRAVFGASEDIDAINYAVDNGAEIINCSWGTTHIPSRNALNLALDEALEAGVAVVAAAGNNTTLVPDNLLPATHIGAITVGASTHDFDDPPNDKERKANFSSYGPFVDLVAPGGSDDDGDLSPFEEDDDSERHIILSLTSSYSDYAINYPWFKISTDSNYYRLGGTSMSTPLVSGVTALILHTQSNNLALANIYDILKATSDDIETTGVDANTGFGRLNAYNAVTTRCLTPYNDVSGSHWAEEEIRRITCRGIASGCNSTDYCPNNNVTEAVAAVYIIRAAFTDNFEYTSTPHFSDVGTGHWAFKYIQKMYDAGINTNGCGGGEYCPKSLVNRAEAAAYTVRAGCGESFNYPSTPYFNDVGSGHWAFKYIQELKQQGIISGCGSGNYCPNGNVNRAGMAAFIGRNNNDDPNQSILGIWNKGRVTDCNYTP
jgi:hypothetical protein